MAGTKTKKEVAAPSPMRYLPLMILLALVVFVGAVVGFFLLSPPSLHYPVSQSPGGCVPGTMENCSIGSCGGTSFCLADGTWGGCTWQRVCTPGVRDACIQNGCAYAYKTCNQCGSGYGACAPPNSTVPDSG
jgi:hypothetical protein